MSLGANSECSVRDHRAQHHVQRSLIKAYNRWQPSNGALGHRLEDDCNELPDPPKIRPSHEALTADDPTVAIIGAGAAGLFTALLFDYLNDQVPALNVSYDIFESQSKVGGRLFTYNFSDLAVNPHDYYDVGAMRFPDNPVMERYALLSICEVLRY